MPLDPQVQALLAEAAASGRPPYERMSPAEARRAFLELKDLAGPPEPVARVEHRTIPGPGGEIPVRVYRPDGRPPFPGLVYYHGGGWVIGDLDTHDSPVRALVHRARCVAVSVGYRLAPEHKFPAAVEDAFAAFRWTAAHADSLGIDPTRIAVAGDSAGGNLAAVVPLMARDEPAPAEAGGGPAPAFQLLIYPVIDHDFTTASYRQNATGYQLTRRTMQWFWEQYLGTPEDGRDPHASPLRAEDLHGLPPAFVITAEFDPLRDEGEAYARRLREAGVPAVVRRYDGLIHGFFRMAGVLDAGRRAIEEAAAALRQALG